MSPVSRWTGRTALLLKDALRLTNEGFAERLGIAVRTVAAWHEKPDRQPKPEMQQLLDTALERATAAEQARFAEAVARSGGEPGALRVPASDAAVAEVERRLTADANVGAALDWLDRHAGRRPGSSRADVASVLAGLDVQDLHDAHSRRRRIDQRSIAQALAAYYGSARDVYGRYHARVDGNEVMTSILTCGDWLDLDCLLTPKYDRLIVAGRTADSDRGLDEDAVGAAVQRLAEILTLGTKLTDMPLYSLLDARIQKGLITGHLGLTNFVHYALTMDLLEAELIDALAMNGLDRPGALPLRTRYLPDVGSALALKDRLCAGGALALCAIARPAGGLRDEPDYLLLVQERSADVVNAARRLAVIPRDSTNR